MRTKKNIVKKRLQTLWLLLAWVAGSTQAGQSWSLVTSTSYNQGGKQSSWIGTLLVLVLRDIRI